MLEISLGRIPVALSVAAFSNARMGLTVDNCVARDDTFQISTTSLHCRKLESLDYSLVVNRTIVGLLNYTTM